MTVQELLDFLRNCPLTHEVSFVCPDGSLDPVEGMKKNENEVLLCGWLHLQKNDKRPRRKK